MTTQATPPRAWPFLVLAVALTSCGSTSSTTPAPAAPVAPTEPALAAPGAGPDARGEEGSAPAARPAGDLDAAVRLIQAQDFAGAKAKLLPLSAKDPGNPTVAYYLGVALENLGDKKGAEQRYQQALKLAPDLTEAAVNLAALYLDAARWDEAILVLGGAIDKHPDDAPLHANLAMALQAKGKKEQAVAEYRKAARLAPDNAEIRYANAALLLDAGKKDEAAVELKAALPLSKGNRPMLASVARLLGSVGAYPDCVAALDQAIASGDDPELRVRRGLCRHALHDERAAQVDFRAALAQDAKFAPAHYYLGESLLAAGKRDEALKELTQALASNPQSDLGRKAKLAIDAAKKSKSAK